MIEALKTFAKKHIYIQVANLFFVASGLIIHLYLSGGVLSIEEYGSFKLIISIVGTLSIVLTTGLPMFAIQQVSRKSFDDNKFVSVLMIDVLLNFLLIGVLFAFPSQIGGLLFSNAGLAEFLPVVAIVLPSYLLNSFVVSYLNAHERFGMQSLASTVNNVIKLAAVFVLTANYGVAGAIMAYGISGLAIGVFAIVFMLAKRRINFPRAIKGFKLLIGSTKMWSFVIPLTVYSFLFTSIVTQDLLIVENSLSAEEFGVYSIVTILSGVLIPLFAALGAVFFPTYSKQTDPKEIKKELRKDLAIEFGLAIGGVSGYAIFGSFVLGLFYGQEFGQYSGILTISAFSYLSYAIMGLVAVKLQSINKQLVSLGGVITVIVALQLLGPDLVSSYGLEGAAVKLAVVCLPVLAILLLLLPIYVQRSSCA